MDILTTIEPYVLAIDITYEQEAIAICAEILKRWNLPQKGYEEVLEEIPEYAIKQYLRKKSREKKAHRERLSDLLKERANRQNRNNDND